MPGLDRERFIANTLYKKLWKHDNNAMSILDVAFFLCFYLCFNRMIGNASLEKCWETFYKEVFLCFTEVTEAVIELNFLILRHTIFVKKIDIREFF